MRPVLPYLISFNDSIQNIDISFFNKYYDTNSEEYKYLLSPTEHYRILVYLSSLVNNVHILDVGTHNGASALALAQNKSNHIWSYDIEAQNIPFKREVPNISFMTRDMFEIDRQVITMASFILLDVSPHNGEMESRFLQMLIDAKYQGLLVCDDISLNEEMSKFWESIPKYKLDVSKYGHFSGTGIVNFNPTYSRFILQ